MEGEIEYKDISKVETAPIPLIDPGVGGEIILRHFFFKAQPRPRGIPAPTKLEIVSYYKKMIETMLWSDGLTIREDKPLEVYTLQQAKKVSKSLHAKMSAEGSDFVILCLATPRRGQTVQDFVHKIK